jgi:putative FmdB family regulatory protein
MPTYEYACSSCRRHFEVVQRFSDAPLEVCEECGGQLKRVFHPVGIVLKGSGFYSTDNRSGKALSPGGKESKDSSSSSSSSESKSSESKPAESKSESTKTEPKKVDPGKSA